MISTGSLGNGTTNARKDIVKKDMGAKKKPKVTKKTTSKKDKKK